MKQIVTLTIIAAAATVAGCGSGSASPSMLVPNGIRPRVQAPARATAVPDVGRKGLYVSNASEVLGFRAIPRRNRPRTCTVQGAPGGGIAVDGRGNLIEADGGSRTIRIFQGPKMCGPEIGSFGDQYGQPSDVASANAATGAIVVANIFDTSGAGSISVCTLAGGCTRNLTNPAMYEVAGVAQAKNGDCWASALDSSGFATLTYFVACAGSGQVATGFKNASYGGLDIDKDGNLVSVDLIGAGSGALWVYKGCNPGCKLVAGPFALEGETVFGHLDNDSTKFAGADFEFGQVDIYRYSTKSLSYEYSFNNGFGGSSSDVEGVAYNPRSKE